MIYFQVNSHFEILFTFLKSRPTSNNNLATVFVKEVVCVTSLLFTINLPRYVEKLAFMPKFLDSIALIRKQEIVHVAVVKNVQFSNVYYVSAF